MVLLVVLVWLVFGLAGWVCVFWLIGIDLSVGCCGWLCLLLSCGFVGFGLWFWFCLGLFCCLWYLFGVWWVGCLMVHWFNGFFGFLGCYY